MASATLLKTGWLIARFVRESASGAGYWQYWCGGGDWPTSDRRSDAFHFSSAKAALECANTHSMLKDSDTWRIIPADRRPLR